MGKRNRKKGIKIDLEFCIFFARFLLWFFLVIRIDVHRMNINIQHTHRNAKKKTISQVPWFSAECVTSKQLPKKKKTKIKISIKRKKKYFLSHHKNMLPSSLSNVIRKTERKNISIKTSEQKRTFYVCVTVPRVHLCVQPTDVSNDDFQKIPCH